MQVELSTVKTLGRSIEATFQIYRRTHLAHFNVRGPLFPQLHAMFEEQYTEVWTALDTLAERARAVGMDVEPSWLSGGITEVEKEPSNMVEGLAADHRAITSVFKELEQAAESAGDTATADLAVERQRAHDQMAWMLEATSEGL